MRIAVSGSIADDYLLTFPGRFADMIIPDQLDRLSLSFLADDLTHHRGGIGANIAFGMGQLGARPRLLGAVGRDFGDGYRQWLEQHDVDCSGVYISDKATARFMCTTDDAQSQIATFYAGAMGDSHLIDLEPVLTGQDRADLLIVSPANPEGMLHHTRQAHEFDVPLVADPSQQLSRMSGPEIRPLIEGAAYLVCNDYERELIVGKTGWNHNELRARVTTLITTHGAKGVTVAGVETTTIPAVAPAEDAVLEPTGAGDAFRAGFLSGLAAGMDDVRSAHLGCAIATMALETPGPQGYQVKPQALDERLEASYGPDAATAIMSALALER
ncbi:carbohydrate kinase family protein [Euzebya tangerina]|uniref:carbohydrate kinase family protein n=1 Tax=Euzebya tangerina TaxID=591198 RepID=UPI000E324CF4|nr:carbohydrate kinase family protein [Euzebya tangerina]